MKIAFLVLVGVLLLVITGACGSNSGQTASPSLAPSPTTTQITIIPTTLPSTSSTPAVTISPSPLPSTTLSEQPDIATLNKYFSELGVGRIPAGADSPINLERDVTLFKTTDQICLYGNILLECQLRSVAYDVATGKVVKEGGLPRPMVGGFAGWEPIDLPVGKYLYKIYIDDILVGLFPFEVTAQ